MRLKSIRTQPGYHAQQNASMHLWKQVFTAIIILSATATGFAQKIYKDTTITSGTFTYNGSITILPTTSIVPGTGQSIAFSVIAAECAPLNANLSTAHNYVLTSTPRISGITLPSQLIGRTACELMQNVQYIDGIGRPLQTIQIKGSPADKDMVQPVAYDEFGREPVKYLPYAFQGTADGSYKSDALTGGSTSQAGFYISPPTGVSANSYPQAQTIFEASPLNRMVEQGAPGAAWQPVSGNTAGHTVKVAYTTNNVIAYTDTANSKRVHFYRTIIGANQSEVLTDSVNYTSGQLTVTVTRDENWVSGRAGTTEEYKDKEGHVVLKRTFNYAGTVLQFLSTYYVYDDLGNLAFVLPPSSSADATLPTQITLDNLCYQYRYDEKSRLAQKKIPGKGWEFMVYNILDQLVLVQDAVQRGKSPQQWTFTKYDGLGRVVMTGIYTDDQHTAASTDYRAAFQTLINTYTTNWETPNGSVVTGYSSISLPTTGISSYLTVNYYDYYTGIPGLPANYTTPTGASNMTIGLLTATKTGILNTPADMLWSVHYYDELGRNIVSYQQHYLGGVLNANNYDKITNTYDFTNELTATTRQHYTSASTTAASVTIANSYYYDHVGRKTQSYEQIKGGAYVLLSQTDFNEIGQLQTKHLHSTTSGAPFLQDIAYTYNERGWLLQSNSPLFQEQLQYNTGTNKQYNGNIAYQLWGTLAAPNTNTYTYTYDRLNRLLSSNSLDNYNENNISYDLAGNIASLNRYTGSTSVATDQLTYAYGGTNQLSSLTDASASNTGAKTGISAYTYDLNGNAITDQSRSAGSIAIGYNLLNLPQNITGIRTIAYTYDASGNKLRRVSAGTGNTDYISGIQYDAGALSSILTDEGIALWNGTSYNYEYYLTDHLGNTRIAFDSHTTTATLVQKDDYYAFGMEISRGTVTSPKNEYLYNKKELQEELEQYDYGARFYDPVIGRWNVVDPIQEDEYWADFDKEYSQEALDEGYDADLKEGRMNASQYFDLLGPVRTITADNSAVHYSSSPYSYVLNNPISYIDPLGLDTGKVTQLNQVNIQGKSPINPWGPILTFLGQPIDYLKPVGALGSESGSSIASWTLSKALPFRIPALKQGERKLIGLVSKRLAKRAGTAVLGRFLGHLVPYIGEGIMAKDVWDNREAIGLGARAFSMGGGDYYKLRSNPSTFYMYAK